ncbi:hypothetical protein RHMOL_Rhmol02G0134200 [Rhododendron molle]|uniref:Uncharacterized protein n=1 Tax=Rhododendron molle TaxID=49168 RepID=A0ACC0PRE8_RHOML|nr:hypothetical protein RHMOL_Rhmol02G0134200 [Rhododendron molle]
MHPMARISSRLLTIRSLVAEMRSEPSDARLTARRCATLRTPLLGTILSLSLSHSLSLSLSLSHSFTVLRSMCTLGSHIIFL